MALKDDIQAISDRIAAADANTKSWTKDLNDLNALKIRATDPADIVQINKLIDATKELRKERKDSSEEERRNLETIGLQNKTLIDLVEKLKVKHELLARALTQGSLAAKSFVKEMDLGKAIQHLGAMTPATKGVGMVLGFAVGAAVKFQDQIQRVNKSIIDLSASTGRFSEGMDLARGATININVGLSRYAQQVGVTSDQLRVLMGNLGKVGFTMEEMGVDKQTGRVLSLSEAIGKQNREWGALSVAIGMARATGLEESQIVSQLQTQIKTMGGSIESSAKSFVALSMAANRSRLSTATLLPVLQSMQSSFKFLGLDSAKAIEMLGKAGQVAEKAGTGAGAAVEVMGKAIAGMAQMDFGRMTFFGQQAGMGGGLTAGFRFREQIGGAQGPQMAQQIGQIVGKLFGGTGQLITKEQATSNEQLAAIRLAQEQFVGQTLGLSQNEARIFVNMVGKLSELEKSGQGQTKDAEKLRKEIEEARAGEAGYRTRVLTAQEKIANILSLIQALVGRAVLVFVRAFAGGAAEAGGLGKQMTEMMTAISKGEGIDNFTEKLEKLSTTFEEAITPSVGAIGKTAGWISGHWYTALAAVFGGGPLLRATSNAFGGFMRRLFGPQNLGGMIGGALRGVFGLGGRVTGSAAGGAIRGGAMVAEGVAGEVVRGIATNGSAASGALRTLTGNTTAVSTGFRGFLSSIGTGLGRLLGVITSIGGITAIFGAAVIAITHDMESSAEARKAKENEITAATNKHILSLMEATKVLQDHTHLSNQEALDLVQRIQGHKQISEDERKIWEKDRLFILRQAYAEVDRIKSLHESVSSSADATINNMGIWSRLFGDSAKTILENVETKARARKGVAEAVGEKQSIEDMISQMRREQAIGPAEGQMASEAIQKSQEEKAQAKEEAGAAGPTSSEHNVLLKIRADDEKFGMRVDERIKLQIDKDKIAPGKSSMSESNHGTANKW